MSDEVSWITLITAIMAGAIARGTPMAFVAIGEAVVELSGIINIGVEGMMLLGALVSIAVDIATGSPILAIVAGGLAASGLACVHGILCVRLNINQIVSGFTITVLGAGLSGYFGRELIGARIGGIDQWKLPVLGDIPVVGEIFFNQDALVYASIITAVGVWFLIFRTSFGLKVRAVGQDPHAAALHGVPVRKIRFIAVALGGFLAGVGGSHLALAYTHVWVEHMTNGQGWIALALIIVAGWNPLRCLFVAWFFGGLLVLHPHLQTLGLGVSSYLIAMLPYLLSIIILTVVVIRDKNKKFGVPAALMKPFTIEEK